MREEAHGKLSLNAVPWAHVFIDGKKLSKPTPLLNYRVRAGKHRVRLEGPNGTVKNLTLDIVPGEEVTRVVKMR